MQLFPRSANVMVRAFLALVALMVMAIMMVWYGLTRSAYATGVGMPREQPVAFSHLHHVQGLGLDCRYCHTSVEVSSSAGIPATSICMNCHSQVWWTSPMLDPVRASFHDKQPLRWTRVNDLPDFVYFNHSIHVAKGIGCTTCHGQVDQMPLTFKGQTLFMQWCLECHRDPQHELRPRDEVFNMAYVAPDDQAALGKKLFADYNVRRSGMTNCSTCHR